MIWQSAHALVDRHFAGQTSAAADRRMFRHLGGCEACRLKYRAGALLEAVGPDAGQRARARLGRTLFPARRPTRPLVFGGAVALAAVALLLVVRPREEPRARGGAAMTDGAPALAIYRVPRDGTPERVGAVIKSDDAVAFSYLNPPAAAHPYLMVFAVDGARRVYWFWPAWQDPSGDPRAIPISRAAAPVELGEAVRHALAPGPLTIVGLFADRPFTVREVERAVAADALPSLGGALWTERFEVVP